MTRQPKLIESYLRLGIETAHQTFHSGLFGIESYLRLGIETDAGCCPASCTAIESYLRLGIETTGTTERGR